MPHAGACLNALMSDGRLPARRHWVGWAIGLVIVLLVFAVGWVVIRGFGAVSELQAVRSSVGQLQTAIDDRDFTRAEYTAPRIEQHAALAHDLTSDPVWRGFEFIPWIGGEFTALREVAEVTADVAADAVTPLAGVVRDADLATLGLSGSRVDLAPFANLREPLAASASALAAADLRAQHIEADPTMPILSDAVAETRALVHEASRTVGAMHGASVLLPSMLGGNGPRTYLIAIQNNAELRSDGGVVQALVLMRADNGALSIQRTVSGRDFPALESPLPIDEATAALFGDSPGRIVRDVTSIPEFAGTGEILAQRWQQQNGDTIDGVIAVDVVGLQHLIDATGGVSFGEFTANADSLVHIVASEIPSTIADPAAQDDLVGQAATALLTAALASENPGAILGALSDAAADDRIRIWSAHPDAQEMLAASTLGGALPKDRADDVHVGVLINDRTGGAMDYYADATISTAIGECHGEQVTRVSVTWTNDAPAGLPPSVTGGAELEPGDTRTLIAIYGPEGATAREAGDQHAQLGTRSAVQYDIELPRGESATRTATFTGPGAGERFAHVQHTPMLDQVEAMQADLECW